MVFLSLHGYCFLCHIYELCMKFLSLIRLTVFYLVLDVVDSRFTELVDMFLKSLTTFLKGQIGERGNSQGILDSSKRR